MTILESFFIMFGSDASELETESKKAKKSVDNLQDSLSATDQVSQKLGSSFTNVIKKAGGMLAALASVAAVIGGIRSAAQFSDQLGKLSDALGVDIQELSVWGDVVKKAGGTAEGFQDTVRSMTAALADFATKGKSRAAPFFQELGIKMTDARGKARGFIELLPEIARAFEKLGKAESLGIGQKMGLDTGTIMLLQQGGKAVDELIRKQKELGGITKLNAEIAAKFHNAWDDTTSSFRNAFAQLNNTLLPVLTKFLEHVTTVINFLRKNEKFATGLFIAIGAAITAFVLPPLLTMAGAALVAFAPFFLVGAAVAALVGIFALLYDDIQHFLAGNDSLTGEILKRWPIIGDVLRGISVVVKTLWNTFEEFIFFLVGMFTQPAQAWTRFKDALLNGLNILITEFPVLGKLIDWLGEVFDKVGVAVKNRWDDIVAAIKAAVAVISGAIDTVIAAYNKAKDFLGFGSGDLKGSLKTTNETLLNARSSPLNSQSTNSLISSSRALTRHTSVQVGDINIQTAATDAEGISQSIGGALNTQMDQALNSFDNGVAA